MWQNGRKIPFRTALYTGKEGALPSTHLLWLFDCLNSGRHVPVEELRDAQDPVVKQIREKMIKDYKLAYEAGPKIYFDDQRKLQDHYQKFGWWKNWISFISVQDLYSSYVHYAKRCGCGSASGDGEQLLDEPSLLDEIARWWCGGSPLSYQRLENVTLTNYRHCPANPQSIRSGVDSQYLPGANIWQRPFEQYELVDGVWYAFLPQLSRCQENFWALLNLPQHLQSSFVPWPSSASEKDLVEFCKIFRNAEEAHNRSTTINFDPSYNNQQMNPGSVCYPGQHAQYYQPNLRF
jgi:hypothetical protein